MIKIREYIGKDIRQHLDDVAKMRLKYFKEFPYLYVGTFEYERDYLDGIVGDDRSMLLMIDDQAGNLVAIATGVPLKSDAEIVGEAPIMFLNAGFNAESFYYFGEVIIAPEARGKGLARKIFQHQESRALNWGYTHGCLAVVMREANDPRKPTTYVDSDTVWNGLGYKKTSLTFEYEWPTIQPDGSVQETSNKLLFWTKTFE